MRNYNISPNIIQIFEQLYDKVDGLVGAENGPTEWNNWTPPPGHMEWMSI